MKKNSKNLAVIPSEKAQGMPKEGSINIDTLEDLAEAKYYLKRNVFKKLKSILTKVNS